MKKRTETKQRKNYGKLNSKHRWLAKLLEQRNEKGKLKLTNSKKKYSSKKDVKKRSGGQETWPLQKM